MAHKYSNSFWGNAWIRYKSQTIGLIALLIIAIFLFFGIYAPFLASSKPIYVVYDNEDYYPLFRYLFYNGFYTKKIDLFFNLLIFTFPLFLIALFLKKNFRRIVLVIIGISQIFLFVLFSNNLIKDPASDSQLILKQQTEIQKFIKEHGYAPFPNWEKELSTMNNYAKLNLLLQRLQRQDQQKALEKFEVDYRKDAFNKWIKKAEKNTKISLLKEGRDLKNLNDQELKEIVLKSTPKPIIERATAMPTLYEKEQKYLYDQLDHIEKVHLKFQNKEKTQEYYLNEARKNYFLDKENWIRQELPKITHRLMPLIRSFHWEEDAGGEQALNKYISMWELTRINRKDMVSALIFGIRISLTVGITAVLLSLSIGIPVGAFAGYYGGRFDIVVSRLLEIWEAMPTLFMLLLIVAITQSKSIILIVTVIGLFGWTTFSRFIRGEFFKQKSLSYVEACRSLGFKDNYIIFSHILPNAIPPLLTLLPFAIMGAITTESALSFLGLGEEGSCSWGVLMDEGRTAFPGESYLLWPPAILLTILLIAFALCGDSLRNALDPKLD